MKHAVKHVHFVGVGGTGMSGIAEILHNLGYHVSGSDIQASTTTDRLAALGVRVAIGHDAAQVAGAHAVVISSAVAADNPEVVAAREQRIPVVPRAVMLAELMRLKQGIAIAGTHGKTTTTSLVASVLAEAGLDPTFVIGGKLLSPQWSQAVPAPEGRHTLAARLDVDAEGGLHSKLGAGEFIVVEADESDASFLNLSPVLAVVTNIDVDHMDTYGHDVARLHGAFVDFVHRLPFYGAAIVCADDPGVQAVLPALERPVVTYGLGDGAMLRATEVRTLPGGRMGFVAQREGQPPLVAELNLAGVHNVCNALAAIAVAAELELPDAPVQRALARFAGVGRRFQRWGELPARDGGRYTLIDDYGHHPAEMAAVLAAARGAFPGQRLVLAFQPHRYSRTRDCLDDFARMLRQADAAWVTEIYAAGETPLPGVDGATLAQRAGAGFVADVGSLLPLIAEQARGGDVVIMMGAGSIGQLPPRLRAAAEGPA